MNSSQFKLKGNLVKEVSITEKASFIKVIQF